MAAETLRPSANGDLVAWTPVGDTAHWNTIDESSSDGDTTYNRVSAALAGDTDFLVNLPASAIGASDTINSVELHLVCARAGAGTDPSAQFIWKENATTSYTGSNTITSVAPTYTEVSETKTTRPSDSGAWTLTDINALQIGCRRAGNAAAAGVRVTQAWAVVNYTVAGANKSLTLLGVGQ